MNSKIPVVSTILEFDNLVNQFPGFNICPYLAYKDADAWERSTSRVYMNQVLDNFLYIPVNIAKNNEELLIDFINRVKDDLQVVGINITQPHKSNPIVSEILLNNIKRVNYDALLRDEIGKLQPFDLNGPSFIDWYLDEVGDFIDKTIVLIGVGGVGEPLAKAFAQQKPARLLLIDINDKSSFADELNSITPTYYADSVGKIEEEIDDKFILINAAGKEGSGNDSAQRLIDDFSGRNNVFVDLRPHLEIDIVEYAKNMGWLAYTGHGMNARNDYTLLQNISKIIGETDVISFVGFQKLVAEAS